RQIDAGLAGKADRLGHVGGVRAPRDQARALVYHRVVELPCLLVLRMVGVEHLALQPALELNSELVRRGHRGHLNLLKVFGRSTDKYYDKLSCMSSEAKALDLRKARGEDTRLQILDAARAKLAEHGAAGTTTRSIAARGGVRLSLVHYHFGGKQQLLAAVLDRENERLLERQ